MSVTPILSGSTNQPPVPVNALQISVVIPTYNRRESLLRALRALTRQTFPAGHFEVIVVSDGSTDGTKEAVQALQTPYQLTFVEQSNSGPSVARNRGAELAQAPLLVYMDDDIEPVPGFLQEHASAHAGVEDLVLIGPQSEPPDESAPHWIAWEHRMLQRQYDNFVNGVWRAGPNNLYSGNFSVRREHLLAVGGFDVRFTRQEDVELGFRLAQRGLRFDFNPRAIGYHRPTRPFASWYRTPFEYGRRDVQMARELGEERAMELARRHFRERNLLTQWLARMTTGVPILEEVPLLIGRAAVRWGGRRVALVACSLLFNLRYLQGMCRELGGRRQLWKALRQVHRDGATGRETGGVET
ncbi:MAG: glycosyltransferase family A protein [Chloroherpetonaceae bacterium]|nr:glycosyltransferase family 2 protein [Chthonomonadaceae bacterium]MDW8207281.1 glycosyltransferase family A protein [Chloroherpetonaceae bacterium]